MIETEVLTPEDKRELIERVASSTLFRKAPRLREFFLYSGACTLSNRLEDVREQAIAEKVFRRTAETYDLQDSIVRAEARNLRKRLELYFETEGQAEPATITMPKGGYALAFHPRLSQGVVPTALEHPAIQPAPVKIHATPLRPVAIACILLAAAAIVAAVLAIRWYPDAPPSKLRPVFASAALPLSSLFDPRQDTSIVTSDTAFLQISLLAHRRLTLDEYLMHSYPVIPHLSPPDLIQGLNRFQYTDSTEVSIAGLMMRKNASSLQRTLLRSGRQVQLADLKRGNVILLGSPISNPWAEPYCGNLNFQFEFDAKHGILIRNRTRKGAELAAYPAPGDSGLNRDYAQIAFLTNPAENSSALLIAGTTAEATGAAGEFLLNDKAFAATLKNIGINPTGPPRYFELLLRATTFVGGATQSEIIAWRVHPYSGS